MTGRLSLSRRAVAWLCMLLLLAGVLPMYALSQYNHAFYDDFGFSLLTRDAWRTEGTVPAVLKAAWVNTFGNAEGTVRGTYNTWEGTYASSFLSALQPAVFGEGAYWATTVLLLTAFLFSVWFFLSQTLRGVYGMNRGAVTAVFGLLGFVLTQFVPDAAEAFYWYNGGVAYTLLWSAALLGAGLWLRFDRAAGAARRILLYALLLVLTVLVGGAKYSTVLTAALAAVCYTAWAFFHKRSGRWAYLSLTLLLLACFAFSVRAPGNAVRAATLSGSLGAPKAVLEAVYFGLALVGHSFSLPLLASLALLALLAVPALRQSPFRFAHPVWATLLCLCLFCAQLAPTLYTGNYLGDGRVLDTYFYTLVILLTQLTLYWTGWFLRRRERLLSPASARDALPEGAQVKAVPLLIVAGMLLVGCVAYSPDGAASYGPQNMAGGSALRSLVNGQAAAYDAAMDARDALLNDPARADVTLAPVTFAPPSFMGDALESDNLGYVLSLYADYYDKASVRVAGGEE